MFTPFRKLLRHHKRIHYFTTKRKLYYLLSILIGEFYRKRAIGGFGPRLIEITLTNRCQCKCVHCYNENAPSVDQRAELSSPEIKRVLTEAAKVGFTEVNFTGGEPLMREDIIDLIAYARTAGRLPKMNTNGIMLTDDMVKSLKEAGLGWCAVSIDSPNVAEHDNLRRYEGCFDQAIAGIRKLIAYGIPASLTTYVRRESLANDYLERIVKLGHEVGVETVRILFPVPIGGFEGEQHKVLSLEERQLVRRLLADPLVTMESPKERTRCTAAVTKVNVMADGNVTPCVFVPMPYGNIRKESLKQIWKRMASFDKMMKPDGQCPMCDETYRKKITTLTSRDAA